MSFLNYIDSMPLVQSLGWMLLHFIWQGAVLAAVLAIVLSLMRQVSANARYITCCAGMLLMLIAPVVTLTIILLNPARPIAGLVAGVSLADLDSLPIWHRLSQYLPALTLCWLTGVCIFQGKLIVNWLGARHLRRAGATPAAPAWRQSVDELCLQLGIRRRVEILESTLASVPMVLGWLNPVILVPVSALTGLTGRQLITVIAHELAHVRRHDYIINLIQAVFESLLFYHPAVWWLSNRLRVEREYCCDDIAVKECGDALCYARALSSLELLRADRRQPALASTGGYLMHRIFRIVGIGSKPGRRAGGWLAPILIALSLTAAASAMIVSSAGDGKNPDKKVVKVKAIDQVDIVALAKKLGSERAKLLYDLREAGLDNDSLLVVLSELEPDKDVVKAVTIAAKEEMAQMKKMAEYEKQLIEKMKADGASKEEITEAIEQFRKQAKMKLAGNPMSDELAIKEKKIIEKMQADGASKEEIKKAIEQFRKQAKKKLAGDPTPDELAIKEKKIIEKMQADGASKEEIKKAIEQFRKEAKIKVASNPKAELAAKEEYLIQKMKAEGASEKEIKQAVMKLREKVVFDQLSTDEKALVEKMAKAGYSKEEISKALYEHQMKVKVQKDSEFEAEEKYLIQKMQADGASDKEIQQAVLKLREKAGISPPEKHDLMLKEEQLIEEMKANGASKQEIKEAIAKLRASAEKPAKIKVKLTEKDKELFEKMREAGMSDEEIIRVLKAMKSSETI